MNQTIDVESELGKVYDHRMVARLVRYLWPYRRQLGLAALLLVVLSLLELAGPLLTKAAIDRYLTAETALTDAERWQGIELLAGAYLAVLLGAAAIRYSQTLALNLAGQRAMHDLRLELFERLEHQSLTFFDRRPVGALITRLTNDVEALNEFLTSGLLAVASDLLALGAIAVVLLLLNWQLALLTYGILLPLVLATNGLRRGMRGSFRAIRVRIGRLNAYLAENLGGIQTLQLFGRELRSRAEFQTLDHDLLGANLRSVLYFSLFYPTVSLISAAAVALMIWQGGGQILAGLLTIGSLVAFIQYLERFFAPIRDLAEKVNILQAAMAAGERIFELIDAPVQIVDRPQPVEPPPFRGRIELEDVWFAYDSGAAEQDDWVLRGLSFVVQPGERVALVGATGAGKTSIISLISRFYEPQRGRVLLDGLDVRDYRQADLRRRLAVVLQDPFLFAGTIARNIRLLDERIDEARLRWAAEYVNAAPFIARLPHGYATEVHERGAGLSVGQKQLLAFARAVASGGDSVLILDEATSSIDSETEAAIQQALTRLMANRTSVIIAHRLSTVRDVDRLLVLHQGRLIEQGSHAELLAQGGQYARLYALQHREQAATAG
jgi:ATP-binding cassette, subfamily B, multidrug efflux pump